VDAPTVDWLGLYLLEDLGPGDITSEPLFAAAARGRAHVVARERLLVAGTPHAVELFARLGAAATARAKEGTWVERGAVLLDVEGPSRALLAGERTALNLLSRMAGVASATRELAERLAADGCGGMVAGTRKTTPGFRAFEKEAIRVGGGDPHRAGLWDEAMVKDNHIQAAGGDVARAVRTVKSAHPDRVLTCEVETLAQARAAAEAGADWILVDNQDAATARAWAEDVWRDWPNVKVECSGGIHPGNVLAYGWADRVSMGWLTQKVPAKDIAMDWVTR